jgi:4-hydroxy-3-methylbut-2-en-1-yl diphosphate synthase IspG/GcpE
VTEAGIYRTGSVKPPDCIGRLLDGMVTPCVFQAEPQEEIKIGFDILNHSVRSNGINFIACPLFTSRI